MSCAWSNSMLADSGNSVPSYSGHLLVMMPSPERKLVMPEDTIYWPAIHVAVVVVRKLREAGMSHELAVDCVLSNDVHSDLSVAMLMSFTEDELVEEVAVPEVAPPVVKEMDNSLKECLARKGVRV